MPPDLLEFRTSLHCLSVGSLWRAVDNNFMNLEENL